MLIGRLCLETFFVPCYQKITSGVLLLTEPFKKAQTKFVIERSKKDEKETIVIYGRLVFNCVMLMDAVKRKKEVLSASKLSCRKKNAVPIVKKNETRRTFLFGAVNKKERTKEKKTRSSPVERLFRSLLRSFHGQSRAFSKKRNADEERLKKGGGENNFSLFYAPRSYMQMKTNKTR